MTHISINEQVWHSAIITQSGTKPKLAAKTLPANLSVFFHDIQGCQGLDDLGKKRLKPPVETIWKKQVLDSENGQHWSKL